MEFQDFWMTNNCFILYVTVSWCTGTCLYGTNCQCKLILCHNRSCRKGVLIWYKKIVPSHIKPYKLFTLSSTRKFDTIPSYISKAATYKGDYSDYGTRKMYQKRQQLRVHTDWLIKRILEGNVRIRNVFRELDDTSEKQGNC